MKYMTQKQLIEAFDENRLDETKGVLCTYGDIVKLSDWQDENGIFCREYLISHHGIIWDVRMQNGEVMSIGYNVA